MNDEPERSAEVEPSQETKSQAGGGAPDAAQIETRLRDWAHERTIILPEPLRPGDLYVVVRRGDTYSFEPWNRPQRAEVERLLLACFDNDATYRAHVRALLDYCCGPEEA